MSCANFAQNYVDQLPEDSDVPQVNPVDFCEKACGPYECCMAGGDSDCMDVEEYGSDHGDSGEEYSGHAHGEEYEYTAECGCAVAL